MNYDAHHILCGLALMFAVLSFFVSGYMLQVAVVLLAIAAFV